MLEYTFGSRLVPPQAVRRVAVVLLTPFGRGTVEDQSQSKATGNMLTQNAWVSLLQPVPGPYMLVLV